MTDKQDDLQFQDFGNYTSNNTSSMQDVPIQAVEFQSPFEPTELPTGLQTQPPPQQQPQTPQTSAFWTMDFYKPYFNVDSSDVGKRILNSFLFFKPDFLSNIKTNADIWGPFWLCTSLIAVMVITSNVGAWVNIAMAERDLRDLGKGTFNDTDNPVRPTKTVAQWTNDFTLVTIGSTFIYAYMTLVPLVLWLCMKWKNIPVSLIDTLCIFGYSVSIYFPTAIACVVSIELVRWVMIGLAFAISTLFLVCNFFSTWQQHLQGSDKLLILLFIAFVVVLQVSFALFVKFFFYSSRITFV